MIRGWRRSTKRMTRRNSSSLLAPVTDDCLLLGNSVPLPELSSTGSWRPPVANAESVALVAVDAPRSLLRRRTSDRLGLKAICTAWLQRHSARRVAASGLVPGSDIASSQAVRGTAVGHT